MQKLIRITTVPQSLSRLLDGQLRFMSHYYEVLAISSSGELLEEVRRKEGINTISLEMTRTISPLKDLKAVWKLYNILKRERPLIVHTHTPKAGTIGMLASKLARVPIRLHTVAGLPLIEARGLKRLVLDIVEMVTYSFATRVYPNSIGLYNFILKHHYCKKKKLKVLAQGSSNGINIKYFHPSIVTDEEKEKLKSQLKLLPDDFIFIFIGRLVKDKGVNELIQAFSQLLKTYKKIKLLILGKFEADLDPLNKNTLKNLKENPSIVYAGYQADIRPYLAISNVMVFPSYREGLPNVILQAGAMGIPSIVSDINGCNEIIVSEQNGIIVPPKNVNFLYQAMKRFIDEQGLSLKLGMCAREHIISRYQQKFVWDALLKEYKNFEKLYGEKVL